MILADFGVAFVIVLGLAIFCAVLARSEYRRRHPPLTQEEKIARAERELAEANEQIRKINEWDT